MQKIDEAAALALTIRADIDDLIAKGIRYDHDMTIRVDNALLGSLFKRCAELHETLKVLSPLSERAQRVAMGIF